MTQLHLVCKLGRFPIEEDYKITGLIFKDTLAYTSGSQTFLHVDPQLKYTIFCRLRGLAQQLLIHRKHVSK